MRSRESKVLCRNRVQKLFFLNVQTSPWDSNVPLHLCLWRHLFFSSISNRNMWAIELLACQLRTVCRQIDWSLIDAKWPARLGWDQQRRGHFKQLQFVPKKKKKMNPTFLTESWPDKLLRKVICSSQSRLGSLLRRVSSQPNHKTKRHEMLKPERLPREAAELRRDPQSDTECICKLCPTPLPPPPPVSCQHLEMCLMWTFSKCDVQLLGLSESTQMKRTDRQGPGGERGGGVRELLALNKDKPIFHSSPSQDRAPLGCAPILDICWSGGSLPFFFFFLWLPITSADAGQAYFLNSLSEGWNGIKMLRRCQTQGHIWSPPHSFDVARGSQSNFVFHDNTKKDTLGSQVLHKILWQ